MVKANTLVVALDIFIIPNIQTEPILNNAGPTDYECIEEDEVNEPEFATTEAQAHAGVENTEYECIEEDNPEYKMLKSS